MVPEERKGLLPDTRTKGADRRWPVYVIIIAVAAAVVIMVESFLRSQSFSPGERISSPSFRDIVVSEEDSLYPPPDTTGFGSPPRQIFVYLVVQNLPADSDLSARVERSGASSLFSALVSGSGDMAVSDEAEEQFSSGEGGLSGIVKFVVGTGSGEPVQPGNYTIEVYSGGEEPDAVKSFSVEG